MLAGETVVWMSPADYWQFLLPKWKPLTWPIVEASECGLKLTVYWFTATESPGQPFEGIQLTDSLAECPTREHWTSTPQSIPLTEVSRILIQQQAVNQDVSLWFINDITLKVLEFFFFSFCTAVQHQATHAVTLKPQKGRLAQLLWYFRLK